jgi:hypothetical protein
MVTPNNDGASVYVSSDMHMRLGKSELLMEPHIYADAGSPSHTMQMPSDMDMGPDRSNSMVNSETNLISSPVHPMPMHTQFEIKTEEFVRSANVGIGYGTAIDHSSNFSSCMHEPCNQVSISNSPPKVNDAHHSRLLWMSAHLASSVNASANFHWKQAGSLPIKTIAADRLTTTLRI